MRDGILLNAEVSLGNAKTAQPIIVHLTPYKELNCVRDAAMFFPANGYGFVSVSCRGCGESEGDFELFRLDGKDGFDIIDWVAHQTWCDGKIAMWGGSYCGFTQWVTAAEVPRNLATICPVAAVGLLYDYPMVNNLVMSHLAYYCNFVDRDAANPERDDGTPLEWREVYYKRFVEHRPFQSLDSLAGCPSRLFQKILQHPKVDSYWKAIVPDSAAFAAIDIPILSITGHYDGDQRGALHYYNKHQEFRKRSALDRHHLIVGPWNHSGSCVQPKRYLAGLDFGDASVIDLRNLQLEWYDWVVKGKRRPDFLTKRVVVFVEGANCWKSVNCLDDLATQRVKYYLAPRDAQASLERPGRLYDGTPTEEGPIEFVYDPLDVSTAEFERENETIYHSDSSHRENFLSDQNRILSQTLKRSGVVYDSGPFESDIEITGNLRFTTWLSMDVPDTDLQVCLYEVSSDDQCIILTDSMMRARYRESLTTEKFVEPGEVTCFTFETFQFFARRIEEGSRLRLVLRCVNSIYWQKNYNSGGVVALETAEVAQTAHIKVYHDSLHPSVLEVPVIVVE